MTFQTEYHYLVHLLNCALTDKQPEPLPNELSLEKVFLYGKYHEVANLAFLAVEKLTNVENNLFNKWKTYYYSCIKRDIEQEEVLQEVLTALHSQGVKTLQVQGTVVKKLYPSSDLRTMTDIDLIVEKDNLQKASNILQGLGFALEEENSEEWSGTNQLGILLELHTDFFYSVRTFQNGIRCASALNNAFKYATDKTSLNCYVDNTTLYLFNLLHCLKHYLSGGAGIRRILDLYILSEKFKNSLNKEYIGEVLENSKLKKAAERLTLLAYNWFGDKVAEVDISKTEEIVFISKNHGDRSVLVKRKLARKKVQGKKFIKLRYIFSRIFISKQMCYAYYPFCKKHKYPTFLCWIHRLIVLPFSKKKKGILKEIKDLKNTKT